MKRKMRLSFTLLAVLLISVTIISCKTAKKDGATLTGMSGTWVLKSLNGQKAGDIFQGKIPVMNIDLMGKKISGNGGCNTYNGPYKMDNGVFTAPNLATTMMMCTNGNQEPQFFAMLAKENTISITNDVLSFKNEGKVVAEFVRGIDQASLRGKWILETIDGGDMNTLFTMTERIPYIEFKSADSRVSGNAGCNGYGATYKIEGSTIDIGPIMSTQMACPNLKGEDLFTKILAGKSELFVNQNELSFVKEGKTVLKFKK